MIQDYLVYRKEKQFRKALQRSGLPILEVDKIVKHENEHAAKGRELGYTPVYTLAIDGNRGRPGVNFLETEISVEERIQILTAPTELSPLDIKKARELGWRPEK